jgi:hypothetical protein
VYSKASPPGDYCMDFLMYFGFVLRPLPPGEQNRICSNGILWLYFGFVYGILIDGRIITRKTRKSHRNTENIDIRLSVCCTSPAPTPNPRKLTEFTKRGQGRAAPKERPQLRRGEPFFSKENSVHPISDLGVREGGDANRRRMYSKASPSPDDPYKPTFFVKNPQKLYCYPPPPPIIV